MKDTWANFLANYDMRPIIFLGSSQQIWEFLEVCDRTGQVPVGIIDKDYYGNTASIEGIPYIGAEDAMDFDELKKDHDFFVGISYLPPPYPGRNKERRQMFIDIVDQFDLPCANILDPDSRVYRGAKLGKGIFMAYTSVVGAYAQIGDHTQLLGASGVGHHAVIGKNVMLQRQSGVISTAKVGDNVYFCIGARGLKPDNLIIGSDSLIHPGVTVMRDVEPGEVVSLAGKNRKKIYDTVVDYD